MKKIIGMVALAALSYSTTAAADTPAVREMNSYDHILAVATKNRALTNNASEFVIYHQDTGRPCPHKGGKGKHEEKMEGKHHHHHHDGAKHHHHHHKAEKKEGHAAHKTSKTAPATTDETKTNGAAQ